MQKKSIYKYASEAGVPVGLYLTLMSACLLLSVRIPALPMFLLPLCIGFPFVLWVSMKKIAREEPSYNKFSSLWLGGIYSVIFGTLICMFISALYLVLIEPNFIGLYINNALTAIENSGMYDQYEAAVAMMHKAIEAHILPSGFEFLTMMAWTTCFFGSLLSLCLALIISKGGKKVTRQFPV